MSQKNKKKAKRKYKKHVYYVGAKIVDQHAGTGAPELSYRIWPFLKRKEAYDYYAYLKDEFYLKVKISKDPIALYKAINKGESK